MLARFFKQKGIIIPVMILLSLILSVFVPINSAQEDNICRGGDTPVINFGETLVGFLDPNVPISAFCFDAERGTDVTVTLSPISPNLATVLIIGTPFIDNTGLLVDEPLLFEEAPSNGGAYGGTTNIPSDGTYMISIQGAANIQGTFEITLELSGGNVLGTVPTADDTASEAQGTTSFTDIVYGQTDLCTVDIVVDIAFDEIIEDAADNIEPALYCFEASANDIITIELSILEDVPMGYLVVDPLYDGSPNSIVYSQGFAQVQGEPFKNEFFVDRDGQYVLFVVALVDGSAGNFSLSISGTPANIYTCDNEPLATLTSQEWGVNTEDGSALIEINIACSERLAVATFGAGVITQYSVTQESEFVFIYQNRLYTTIALSQDEWTIQRDDGQEFTLQALSDLEACSDEALQTLIRGSWLWTIDGNQQVFFDFTCNNIVFVDDQQNPSFTGDYSYSDNNITITLGEQVISFNNVDMSDGIIIADLDGIPVQLQDVLYEGSDE